MDGALTNDGGVSLPYELHIKSLMVGEVMHMVDKRLYLIKVIFEDILPIELLREEVETKV